ncbi:MAG: phenylalanine--tRNA ligase subunit alpha [Pseudomonadota bacterium]
MISQDDLNALKARFLSDIYSATSVEVLNDIRVSALGKKGEISNLMKSLGKMSPEERKSFGMMFNDIKAELTEALDIKHTSLKDIALEARLAEEKADITLEPRPEHVGTCHPVSKVISEVIDIFAELGFSYAEGPEIESEDYNFTKLNIPEDHPARQMHDTFYLPGEIDGTRAVLRTHTSPVQIRTMMQEKPPIRILVPGKTYRCDSDMTHTPMFHQVEGLVIEDGISLAYLRGTLHYFCEKFFETDKIDLRFRPSFFPFTEPSLEVDVKCDRSGGQIKIGQGNDWLEILGAGMVHPKVLENCGYSAQDCQGFAFGMGIDRLAMLKYGIADLRAFFDSDLRWLKNYGFAAYR